MVGLIGGILLAALTIYFVINKFASPWWVGLLASLAVFAVCTFTGIFGLLAGSLVLGALFKADF
ncbi:MAG: hypothetical protein MK108_10650 [Mariniblastus sp.]|nr:hypothetical protein [Mariniblastus sp.]